MKCEDCCHAEMCKWIDELEGRGCDFFDGEPCEDLEREYEKTKALFSKIVKDDDAISRDMALEKMADYVASGYADSAEDFEEYSRIICQLPSVTQKSGKWIDINGIYAECSNCNEEIYITGDFNYCPNCGCRMVEPQESEDKDETDN